MVDVSNESMGFMSQLRTACSTFQGQLKWECHKAIVGTWMHMDSVGLCHANHIILMVSMEVHGNRKTCEHRIFGHPDVPIVVIA